jgi:hypothetical protein
MSLPLAETGLRLPALPNAVWFFGASPENYLSFKSGSAAFSEREAANGFLAQSFRSPRFHPLLIPAGLALPFSRKTTRRLLGKVIGEDGVRLDVDVTQWHRYRLDWREKRVSFEVDDALVFESQVSPIRRWDWSSGSIINTRLSDRMEKSGLACWKIPNPPGWRSKIWRSNKKRPRRCRGLSPFRLSLL